ncbi:unnamed protein product, partial [Polarella glacialis]
KGGGFGQGAGGKAGGGGGKTGGGKAAARPAPPPLDKPEELRPETRETGEQVAFQASTGTPWRLVGPDAAQFRWELQDRECVSDSEKREIREMLQAYAEEFKIPLRGENSVKLALRRGDFWVSYAGGISSTGRAVAVTRADLT